MDSVVAMSMKCLFVAVVVLALSNNRFEARPIPFGIPSSTLLPAQVWSELEVNLTAAEVWGVYSSPDLPALIVELMPYRYQRIDVLSGDGTQGTVLNVTLQPTVAGPQHWHEQFITVDDTTRTKVVRQIWGGYLDIGFSLYENIFKITPLGPSSCVIKSTTSFVIQQGSESGSSFISASWNMPYAVVDYIRANYTIISSSFQDH